MLRRMRSGQAPTGGFIGVARFGRPTPRRADESSDEEPLGGHVIRAAGAVLSAHSKATPTTAIAPAAGARVDATQQVLPSAVAGTVAARPDSPRSDEPTPCDADEIDPSHLMRWLPFDGGRESDGDLQDRNTHRRTPSPPRTTAPRPDALRSADDYLRGAGNEFWNELLTLPAPATPSNTDVEARLVRELRQRIAGAGPGDEDSFRMTNLGALASVDAVAARTDEITLRLDILGRRPLALRRAAAAARRRRADPQAASPLPFRDDAGDQPFSHRRAEQPDASRTASSGRRTLPPRERSARRPHQRRRPEAAAPSPDPGHGALPKWLGLGL